MCPTRNVQTSGHLRSSRAAIKRLCRSVSECENQFVESVSVPFHSDNAFDPWLSPDILHSGGGMAHQFEDGVAAAFCQWGAAYPSTCLTGGLTGHPLRGIRRAR